MEGISKKLSIRSLLSIYAISFILNSLFFVDIQNVEAAGGGNLSKLVAVIVDKNLYPNIKDDIERYATSYIQSKVEKGKAIILPINIQNIGAAEISKMLENIYFDGVKETPSKLEGIMLIGNIPLPVINDNGFIFPSIYPYVDFEEQQYVYDENSKFFIPNENPNGQAEVRHGILQFTGTAQYHQYFDKLKTYSQDPENFVAPEIWYDDFVGVKKYYINDNTDYYINNHIFAEDKGYRRYSNLMLNTLKGEYTNTMANLGANIKNDVANSESDELKAYADMIQSKQATASNALGDMTSTKTPTLIINKSIKEMSKTYDGLLSTQFLTKIQDNVKAAARRYTKDQASGTWLNNIDSHFEKILQKDNWILGNDDLQPLLIQFNNAMESGLNQKVATEKYAMKYPMPILYENIDYEALINKKKSIYENFYFGNKGINTSKIEDLSIYRGTYQNLDTLSGKNINNINKSIGGSYQVFSQQVEANRGFNLLNTEAELKLREDTKQYLYHERDCEGLGFLPFTDLCLGTNKRNTGYGENHDFENIYEETVPKGAEETPLDFAVRLRGGASPINLKTDVLQEHNKYELVIFDFRHAISSVYDIAGSQRTTQNQSSANSYLAIKDYASMIKTKDQGGEISYPRATKQPQDNIPDNAIDISGVPFVPKARVPYEEVNFFQIFQNGGSRDNTPGTVITLERKGVPFPPVGNRDQKTYMYKLIDTTKKNISPTAEEINGMNLTTADRPIDSVRNIMFQGIGGDTVQLNYPDLYQINVYKKVDNTLVLKNETEILTALKAYLQNKVVEYNNALTTQQNKKSQYYQLYTDAFNFLAQINVSATPNRNYNLLPNDFLINQLLGSINALIQKYGKDYIFGDFPSATNDEKLMLIARLLYYQNSTRTEKKETTKVLDDIQETKDSFNINQKISSTVNTYLQSDNNQGAFLSPTYNSAGYEVAYINSDGSDLVNTTSDSTFIKQLKTIKEQKKEETRVANKILEEGKKDELETSIDKECDVDENGSVLLFDLKTFTSPWFKAMKCWAKKIIKEPFKIKISYNSSLGPSFVDSFQDLGESILSVGQQRQDLGSQSKVSNEKANEVAIEKAVGGIKSKLEDYKNLGRIKSSATSRFVDSTETQTISVGSNRTLKNTRITLSATGDICLGIEKNNQVVSKDLCKKSISFNPGTEEQTYSFSKGNKKTGTMVITAKFCLSSATISSSQCIQKSQTISILPGAIEKITLLPATNILMAGAQMPIIVKAEDGFGNPVGQVIENYDFLTETGTIEGTQKMSFNNFANASFIYTAPEKIIENTPITIKVKGENQNGKALSFEQKIIIAKGLLTISHANATIYGGTSLTKSSAIEYNLPASQSEILKKDANGIAQVQEASLIKITVNLKDKNGNLLDNVLNITSKNNILTPGKIQERKIELSGHTYIQKLFQAQNTIFVTDGKAEIWLSPTLKAGQEELILQMPGIQQPIHLMVNVHPGKAQKVLITQANTNLNINDSNNTSNGEIQVLDYRNNPAEEKVTINIGVMGPGTINGEKNKDITRTGKPLPYTLKTQAPGGNGTIFAFIRSLGLSAQEPATQEFFVQNNVLPTQNLNVMYLNLFGSDRGNQRGYFSDNNQKVNELTQTSEKLLTTTTELIDPTKIKQIQVIVSPHGQIQNFTDEPSSIKIESGQLRNEINTIGKFPLGATANYKLQLKQVTHEISAQAKNENIIIYTPATTDSIVTGNTTKDNKILINNKVIIDFGAGITDINVQIELNGEYENGLALYDVIYNDTIVGTMSFYKATAINKESIIIQDRTKYNTSKVFTEGSTNSEMGIAIYDIQSSFSKNGYQSIEDSNDPLLGIGFTSKFKNISYFAAGESIGKATLPYGSAFLINFGDPLVKRISQSIKVSKTDKEGSVGQEIFSNPNKTIFKTTNADINDDGLQDIIIAYTDGSIQLLKNYGGENPYQNLQNLMLIADTIKEIKVGDVNDDNYPDIIIQTNNDKALVYRNKKGIFDVDGTAVCLNTNVAKNTISSTPNSLAGVHQLFIEDMNQDGNMDIITNDIAGDVKIFYGGADNKGRGYYISTLTGICDDGWFARQKNNQQTVKSFGVKLQSDWLVTDESLVHYKDMQVPDEEEALTDTESPETVSDAEIEGGAKNADGSDFSTGQMMDAVNEFVDNTAEYTVTASKDFAYIENPTEKKLAYENMPAEDIMFLPISNLSGEKVSIYKTYTDLNGGILQDKDSVRITVTILSLKNNNRITYLDQLKGPRTISKSKANEIAGFKLDGTISSQIKLDRNIEDYQVMIDNILLQNNQSLQIEYTVKYKQDELTKIQVKDEAIDASSKAKDGYPDIKIMSKDPCLKATHVLRNTKSTNKQNKEYNDIFIDIDKKLSDYSQTARTTQESQLGANFQQLSQSTAATIASIPGVSDILEQVKNGASDLFNGGGTISLNMSFIDSATAGISKKLDEGLGKLCEGFKVGKTTSSCSGIPVPFNQAFLAPGDYHLFGCVPKIPNPLAAVFKIINKTIGKGLPILAFPTDNVIPIRPPSPSGAGGIFGGATSQFRLYIAPTMTLSIGFAICVGPYALGVKLPKPIRDIAGNCVVFAIPAPKACSTNNSASDTSDSKGGDEVDPDFVDAADNGVCTTPSAVGKKTILAANTITIANEKGTSSPFQAVQVNENTNVATPLVPQGNFGGLVQFDQEPNVETADSGLTSQGDIPITQGEKVTLKLRGGKTKGLVKCIIQKWMTAQVAYIINNMTKMHIQVNLPEMSQMVQGFDKIGNLADIYKDLNQSQSAGGYTTTTTKTTALTGLKQNFSRQQRKSISKKVGENPFEAVSLMFQEVPLININTKTINVKVPAITSEEINKYGAYLQARAKKNSEIVQDREKKYEDILTLCSTPEGQKKNQGLCKEARELLDAISKMKATIKAVQENIKVLDQYKVFPAQLYEWVHVTDRYLAEIGGVTSEFAGGLTSRLTTNANRFSSYVDAITLIISAIKTWQAILDFSINRSEKCSKCSNDNYGSFSCSLSFLCPQLPIFKIPSFKIPDITLDMSHIELGVDILLPKFNFVPLKTPLPELPDLPEAPTLNVDIDLKVHLDGLNLPNIPVLPGPPQLPELPSFLPNVEMKLPVLPPAPKIPNLIPSIDGILKVANFIGKIFCIVKGGIGLVGEKGVKSKIEQLTQRTRTVPVFDFFDLSFLNKQKPNKGFDYEIDAYARLKYNFEGVYALLDSIVQSSNDVVSKTIEAPMQEGMKQLNEEISSGTQFLEDVPTDQNINLQGDINLNTNGYLPTTGMEYTVAYQKLQKEINAFRQQENLDKTTLAKLESIERTMKSDGKVSAAKKEIYEAKAAADAIVEQTRKEIQSTAQEIKSYDSFIKKVETNTIQLVSENKLETTISAPLLKGNESTQKIIAQQESPTQTYLALNKTLVDGYTKAIEQSSALDLNMTQDTYNKSKTYLSTLQQRIAFAQTATHPELTPNVGLSEKTLLAASCVGGNCQQTTMEQNGYKQDLSSYIQGIFVETGAGADKVMVNVVNNPIAVAEIEKNYFSIDINNDKKEDVVMRDPNTIYIKYANQNEKYLSKGGNATSTHYSRYFAYDGPGGKRRIDSIQDLEYLTKGYANFGNIEVKLWDTFREVKNFKTVGQSYDNLVLSWKNNQALGEDVQGYVIKFNYKIENFFEKIKTFNFFGMDTTETKYLVVLPKGTNYNTGMISVDEISKKPIRSLLTGTVIAVHYFDPEEETISLTVNDMPRKRLYTQIAALDIDQSQLSNSQKKTFTLFTLAAPWSNQIVAGNQLLGDREGPEATITLHRVLTNETISTGNTHEGFINTNYALNALREDNAAVTDMSIRKDDIMLYHKTGTNITGFINVPNLFFTGTDKQTYIFLAQDANENVSKEVVNLTINIPTIEIIDVQKIDTGNAQIIAKIQKDLDEGLVSFQRERNGIIKAITGTQANALGGYPLAPKKDIITGGIMSLGNMLALYLPSGEEVGEIDPSNGKITIANDWKNKVLVTLDFVLHIPTIKISNKSDGKQLFQISLPAKQLTKITMLQGKPEYEVVNLTDKQFGAFQGGYCIRNNNSECVVYTNSEGKIYIPSVYGSTLGGSYGFDEESQSIIYTIADETNTPIVKLLIQTKPLITK